MDEKEIIEEGVKRLEQEKAFDKEYNDAVSKSLRQIERNGAWRNRILAIIIMFVIVDVIVGVSTAIATITTETNTAIIVGCVVELIINVIFFYVLAKAIATRKVSKEFE